MSIVKKSKVVFVCNDIEFESREEAAIYYATKNFLDTVDLEEIEFRDGASLVDPRVVADWIIDDPHVFEKLLEDIAAMAITDE